MGLQLKIGRKVLDGIRFLWVIIGMRYGHVPSLPRFKEAKPVKAARPISVNNRPSFRPVCSGLIKPESMIELARIRTYFYNCRDE